MASLILAAAGGAIGAGIGGTFLGLSGAVLGQAAGSIIGTLIDARIAASLTPNVHQQGARLESLRVTTSTEGAVIPRVHGRMRVGGTLIWATDFREQKQTSTQGGGGKGRGGGKVKTTTWSYSASFAVALCEGPISGIGRIWADGKPFDLQGAVWRLHDGGEDQLPDPLIAAKMGAGNTPAYRGLAYVVFDDLALERFGNRLPQLSFEVIRPLGEAGGAETLIRAVNLIPGAGEFFPATTTITRKGPGGVTIPENENSPAGTSDLEASLDDLARVLPNVEAISLVVSWFGTDLRAGQCQIRPGVEDTTKVTSPKSWSVNGVTRAVAHQVSTASGQPVFGGTPADFAVVEAIRELQARGKRVTFYPFLLMDVPAGNLLPDPYSANAATLGQPALPWRGRITLSPAAGFAGSPDRTAAAASQVAAFFGGATPGNFAVSGTSVSWTGSPGDRGYRRMILHYARLCAAAGGVESFLIGSELRGLTTIRSGTGSYPAVEALRSLAADCRAILGPATKIGYAADWTEWFGHQPQDGSGDVFFHLDPLWADAAIDFIGIDNYMPLSDWRDGADHLDAQAGWSSIHDPAYLRANIEGGEGYDWYYASDVARDAQDRTPITDGAHGKPWVFRPKDIRSWWSNPHHNRPGGVESASPTPWVPQSKPIRFTEIGCPAVDKGSNTPNLFFDPKSSESALPWFSSGARDDLIQRRHLEALIGAWSDPTRNPVSSLNGGRMIDMSECAVWCWDARPWPTWPARAEVWGDAANWALGHWLNGRMGLAGLGALVATLCARSGIDPDLVDASRLSGSAPGHAVSTLESPRGSIEPLARYFGFDAVETGGTLRFVPRGVPVPVATLTADDLVAAGPASDATAGGEVITFTRAQETLYAYSFRHPLGNGLTFLENEADGIYAAFGFDEPNPDIGGSHHLGVDWNGEGLGNTDLGDPVHAIGNGAAASVVLNQSGATTGFGNYSVLRHNLSEPTLINGQWVSQVHSLYARLDTVGTITVGQQVAIGTQIGTLGMSGYTDVAHPHFDITIGSVVPTNDDRYNPAEAPSGLVDPVSFVNAGLLAPAATTNTDMLTAARFALAAYSLAGNESPASGADRANSAASAEYGALQSEGWRYLTSGNSGLSTLNSGGTGEAAGFLVVGNAAALVAVRDNTLVLAFRGTNDTGLTPGTDRWDWLHRDVHFANFAYAFLDQLRAYLAAHTEINEVLVTGHSLGAAMCDALFMSSWDLRNVRPGTLDVVGINFADPGYQLGADRGAAANDLTTINFNEDVINFASDFSDLAGDFNRVLTPDSGTSWTTYHSMQGYLSFISYLAGLGVTVEQINAFSGTFFVNGVVAPSGQAFIAAQYGSRINPTGDQNNLFIGGRGADEIYGGAHSDTLVGGDGNDDLRGLDSADALHGSDGNDALYGGLSHDHLWGEDDNDLLRGESGNDTLYGGDGSDNLMGDGGLDRLDGGSGVDRLTGGVQSDVFAFSDADFPVLIGPVPQDRITDFNRGTGSYLATEGDLVDLSGISFANGVGSASTVRLRSVAASGDLPAGAVLEVLTGDVAAGNWQAIARLDGVASGEAVRIALTDADSAARTGSTFRVDAVGDATSWSISPATRTVTEGNVTLTFTITRSGGPLDATTVYASTAQTHGFFNDGDYVGRLNVPVFFAANDTTETFTVRINADAVPEGDETFDVIVQDDPRDPVSVHRALASFTIQDGAPPVVSGQNYTGDSLDNTWTGGAGRDMAFGLGGNDRLSGAGGNDILVGGDGSDSLYGGGGNDFILSGSGTNYVDAGSGNDHISADGAADTILGGEGDDQIVALGAAGLAGIMTRFIDGGAGRDLAVVGVSNYADYGLNAISFYRDGDSYNFRSGALAPTAEIIELFEEAGSYQIYLNTYGNYAMGAPWHRSVLTGVEEIEYRGGAYNDLFADVLGARLVRAFGGAGTDALYADWSTTTAAIVWNITANNDVQRTLGNGVVVQSIERLLLKTGSGNDNLVMGGQDDHVETGAGNDRLNGGGGNDVLLGGSGNDTITGGVGSDSLNGGLGSDVLNYGTSASGVNVDLGLNTASGGDASGDTISGFETVYGGAGYDALTGSAGANLLTGNDGNDSLSGGGGNDTLLGGVGADTLIGGAGADSLAGGISSDSLDGGTSADTLIGSLGKDTMTGGTGSDVFVFDTALASTNVDTIIDFSTVDDTIRLDDAVFA